MAIKLPVIPVLWAASIGLVDLWYFPIPVLKIVLKPISKGFFAHYHTAKSLTMPSSSAFPLYRFFGLRMSGSAPTHSEGIRGGNQRVADETIAALCNVLGIS